MDHRKLEDADYQRMIDYVRAGAFVLKTRHGFRIPALVADQWTEKGYAVLRTNTLAAEFGVGRRTMWKTISGAIEAGFIKEIGRTDEGRAMYIPLFERGDEWRADYNARMAEHEAA